MVVNSFQATNPLVEILRGIFLEFHTILKTERSSKDESKIRTCRIRIRKTRLHQLKLKVLLEQRKIQLQKNINRNLKEYLKILEAEKGDI